MVPPLLAPQPECRGPRALACTKETASRATRPEACAFSKSNTPLEFGVTAWVLRFLVGSIRNSVSCPPSNQNRHGARNLDQTAGVCNLAARYLVNSEPSRHQQEHDGGMAKLGSGAVKRVALVSVALFGLLVVLALVRPQLPHPTGTFSVGRTHL